MSQVVKGLQDVNYGAGPRPRAGRQTDGRTVPHGRTHFRPRAAAAADLQRLTRHKSHDTYTRSSRTTNLGSVTHIFIYEILLVGKQLLSVIGEHKTCMRLEATLLLTPFPESKLFCLGFCVDYLLAISHLNTHIFQISRSKIQFKILDRGGGERSLKHIGLLKEKMNYTICA